MKNVYAKDGRNISFQGIRDSNAYRACKSFMERNTYLRDCNLIADVTSQRVVQNLKREKSRYGVMAFDNIIAGEVFETKEALKNVSYNVLDEIDLPIKHVLATREGIDINSIRSIHSHAQALKQCSAYLHERFPNANLVDEEDTAIMARNLKKNEMSGDCAIICSMEAVVRNGLKVLKEDISNQKENLTRFYLIELYIYKEAGVVAELLLPLFCRWYIPVLSCVLIAFTALRIASLGHNPYVAIASLMFWIVIMKILVSSKYLENYLVYKKIGGYWRCDVTLENIDMNVERLVEISLHGGKLLVQGWLKGSGEKFFESAGISIMNFSNNGLSIAYNYQSAKTWRNSSFFSGFARLATNDCKKVRVSKLSGSYVGTISSCRNIQMSDFGKLDYYRMSRKEFLNLRARRRLQSTSVKIIRGRK